MSKLTQVLSEAYDLICELSFTPQRNILLVKINELLTELESVEPVADLEIFTDGELLSSNVNVMYRLPIGKYKLFTSPQTREWVGLSDDAIIRLYNELSVFTTNLDFGKAIQAKLRELNTKG